jgi:hypothetical protein
VASEVGLLEKHVVFLILGSCLASSAFSSVGHRYFCRSEREENYISEAPDDDLEGDFGPCYLKLLICKVVEGTPIGSAFPFSLFPLLERLQFHSKGSSGAAVEVVQFTPSYFRSRCSLPRPIILQFF